MEVDDTSGPPIDHFPPASSLPSSSSSSHASNKQQLQPSSSPFPVHPSTLPSHHKGDDYLSIPSQGTTEQERREALRLLQGKLAKEMKRTSEGVPPSYSSSHTRGPLRRPSLGALTGPLKPAQSSSGSMVSKMRKARVSKPALPGASTTTKRGGNHSMTGSGGSLPVATALPSQGFGWPRHALDAIHVEEEEEEDPDWATRVWAWGSSAQGQCMEDNHGLCMTRPRWLRALEVGVKKLPHAARRIACGRTVSMVVTDHGDVYSWGIGLGLGRPSDLKSVARGQCRVEALQGVEAVAVGEEHGLACTLSGELYSWGTGAGGRLGHGDTVTRHVPCPITAAPLHQVQICRVACGERHSAAVSSDGAIFTFGHGRAGQLGHGDLKDHHRPKKIGFFEGITIQGVSCGANHTAAYTDDGLIYTWGWGEHGRLGLGNEEMTSTPALVTGALECRHVSGVACGAAHTLVLTGQGQVYAFGWNEYGQIRKKPQPTSVNPSSSSSAASDHVLVPVRVSDLGTSTAPIIQVACGFGHSAALAADGRLYLWGFGEEGQLGTGEEQSSGVPVEVEMLPEDVHVVEMALGHCHTVAIVSRSDHGFFKAAHAESRKLDMAARIITNLFRKVVMRSRVQMLARVQKGCTIMGGERRGGLMTMDDDYEPQQDYEEEEGDEKGGSDPDPETESPKPEETSHEERGVKDDEEDSYSGDGLVDVPKDDDDQSRPAGSEEEECTLGCPATEEGGDGLGLMLEEQHQEVASKVPDDITSLPLLVPQEPQPEESHVGKDPNQLTALEMEGQGKPLEMCQSEEYEDDYEEEEQLPPPPAAAAPPAAGDPVAIGPDEEAGVAIVNDVKDESVASADKVPAEPEKDMEQRQIEHGESEEEDDDFTFGENADDLGDKTQQLGQLEEGMDLWNYMKLKDVINRHLALDDTTRPPPEAAGLHGFEPMVESARSPAAKEPVKKEAVGSLTDIEVGADGPSLSPPAVSQEAYLPAPVEPQRPTVQKHKKDKVQEERRPVPLEKPHHPMNAEDTKHVEDPLAVTTAQDALKPATTTPLSPPPPPPYSPPVHQDVAAMITTTMPKADDHPGNRPKGGDKAAAAAAAPAVEAAPIDPLVCVSPPPRKLKKVIPGVSRGRQTRFGFGSSSSRSPGGLGKAAEEAARRRRENIQKRLDEAICRSSQPPPKDQRVEASPTMTTTSTIHAERHSRPEVKRSLREAVKRTSPPSPPPPPPPPVEQPVMSKPVKKPMRAADLRTEFNYFKERYCKDKEQEDGGDQQDLAEFLRRKTCGQDEEEQVGPEVEERPECEEGQHEGHGRGEEEGASSPSTHLDDIYQRSVAKMHRRLGNRMAHHSAMRLPRHSRAARQAIYGEGPMDDAAAGAMIEEEEPPVQQPSPPKRHTVNKGGRGSGHKVTRVERVHLPAIGNNN